VISSTPLVSVIIPTHNCAERLPKAIESVLSQTYQQIETIIVDDGSTDDTQTILRKYCNQHIHCLQHEYRRGAAAARNSGIRAAKGEMIAFLDADDEWFPPKLERQVDCFEQLADTMGVVYCDAAQYDASGALIANQSPHIDADEGPICRDGIDLRVKGVFLQSALVRRSCLETVSFDERLARYHDLDFFIQLARKHAFHHIDEALFRYTWGLPGAISTRTWDGIDGLLFILDKYWDLFTKDRGTMHRYLQIIGGLLSNRATPQDKIRCLLRLLSLSARHKLDADLLRFAVSNCLPMPLQQMAVGAKRLTAQVGLMRKRISHRTKQRRQINPKYGEPRLQDLVTTEAALMSSLVHHGALVLDAGCGEGRNSFRLVDELAVRPDRIVMLDINPQLLEKVRKNIQVEESTAPLFAPVMGSIFEIPCSKDTFDAVICLGDVLSLASAGSIEEGLQELRRVTKTGGVLLLSLVTKDYLLAVW
jgi:glycosyltransferase involved in cell wall biosynthesis